MEVIKEVKSQLSSKFDMKDLGDANFILGMEIKRDHAKRKLWLNKRKYVETILQRFNMHGSKLGQGSYSYRRKVICISVSQDTRRRRGHVPCSICQCSWQFDVCNGLY
jgi:hypothetical protein